MEYDHWRMHSNDQEFASTIIDQNDKNERSEMIIQRNIYDDSIFISS